MVDDVVADRIHEASLSLLKDPGVRVEHNEVRRILIGSGAREGRGADVVRVPGEMVEEALALCPRRVALTDRSGNEIPSRPAFWSCPGLNLWLGGEHRPFTSSDMAQAARLLDQLGNVDVVFGMSMDDVPPPARDIVGLTTIAKNSSKHIRVLCFTPAGADVMARAKPVVGDHPWFSIGFTAHGPLRWTHLALEIFRRTAGHGIPTTINGEPMAGVSGPVSVAGSAAVGNAEILAGIVVNQLLEPGRPCIYNLGLAHVFDMRTATAVTGGPENALFAELSAVMGRFYRLPSCSWVSTEAMCPDPQAALEKMFGFHAHMEAGVTHVWGVGQLESEMTFSPTQAVIDNEMISYARRHRRGVEVNAESLAVEVTQAVGIAGSFLDQDHTLEHFRSEFYVPEILFRGRRADWSSAGRKRLDEVAEEKARQLMGNEVDNALTGDQVKALDELARAFLERVGRQ